MEDNQSLTCTTETKGNIKTYLLTWKIIEKSDMLVQKLDYQGANQNLDSPFQLKMKVFGKNNEMCQVYFLSPVNVFMQSELKNQQNSQLIVSYDFEVIRANMWHYMATITKENDACSYTHWQNGPQKSCLVLIFKFTVYISNQIKFNLPAIPKAQLNYDFRYLLTKNILSDAIIKSSDGKEFKVHKAILASRSKVLKAHFVHKTIESETNIIQTKFSSEVLEEMLQYIYCDESTKVNDIAKDLLEAADYYDLEGLKYLCVEALFHKK